MKRQCIVPIGQEVLIQQANRAGLPIIALVSRRTIGHDDCNNTSHISPGTYNCRFTARSGSYGLEPDVDACPSNRTLRPPLCKKDQHNDHHRTHARDRPSHRMRSIEHQQRHSHRHPLRIRGPIVVQRRIRWLRVQVALFTSRIARDLQYGRASLRGALIVLRILSTSDEHCGAVFGEAWAVTLYCKGRKHINRQSRT